MGATAKRSAILIVIVLLIMTGLGATLLAQGTQAVAPGTTGIASVSSPLDVPLQCVPSQPIVCASGASGNQQQLAVLSWQLEEAWRQGDWLRCIDVLTIVIKIDPVNVAARERLFQAHVNHGWLLLSATRFDDAYRHFAIALQLKPGAQEPTEGLRLLQQLIVPPAACPTAQPPVCTVIASPTICPTAAALACAQAGGCVHIVQRGDTLFRLALRFNTSVALIMKVNGLQTTTIKVGQKLIIP